MIPQSVRCSSKHTENKSITASEKACQSVSRRRPCSIEQGNSLLKQWQNTSVKATIERGNPLWKTGQGQNLEQAQILTFFGPTESANLRGFSSGDQKA